MGDGTLKREYDFYLQDVLEAIRRIFLYVEDKTFEDFQADAMMVDAVLRNLEVIGEAITQVPLEVKESYKEIPWRDIQDFRIIVAHKYWKINLERVWDVIENKL